MSAVVIAETVRRHLTSVAFLTYAAITAFMAFVMARFDATPGSWHGFVALLVVVAGCQLIGPEFSSGTLQLILAKPINRSVYLVSRYAGVIVAIGMFLVFAWVFEVLGRVSRGMPIDWKRMSVGALNVWLEAFLICALLVLFGSFLRSYINVALYFLLQISISVTMTAINEIRPDMPGPIGMLARFFGRHPEIALFVNTVGRNLFPDRPHDFDRKWFMLVLSNSAVALLLACLMFRSREVPYGAD